MKRLCLVLLLFIIAIAVGSCSNDNHPAQNDQALKIQEQVEQYARENEELKQEISNLRQRLTEHEEMLNEKPVRMERASGLLYISVSEKEKIRFIRNEIDLKALPFDDAPSVNSIQENSLIRVYDKVSNTGNPDDIEALWYYVSIPVYDTPMDYKGWVKCVNTEDYNEKNQQLVQSDVSIRLGAKYTESASLPDPNDESQWKICEEEIGGRIIMEQDGYVYIEGTGGSVYWVKKDDVVYPPIQ